MYIDYENKVMYQGAPRTGTRTVKDVVVHQLGFVEHDPPHSHHANVCSVPGSLYTGFGSRFHDAHLRHGGWKVLTVIRNHYERIASHYRLNHETSHPTEDPDLDAHIRKIIKQSRQIAGRQIGFYYLPWTLHATHIIRYERLAQGLKQFLYDCGYRDFEIKHIGKSKASCYNYRDYFSEETKALVEKEFGTEMKLLDYHW